MLFFAAAVIAHGQDVAVNDSVRYYFSPVLVTATQAKERETPVTFTNLSKGLIQEQYSMQDVPVLLSQLPSMLSYSDGGNGVGYTYVFLRGFDQRRLSVMVNGIPQNDPEDHNVYWIDFPDLLASAASVQVQRGAGSAFYGPPAIGGSVNIVTNPFTPKPYAKFEAMFGFQEYGDSSQSLPMTMRKLSASFNSGLIDKKYMFYGRLGKIQSNGYRIRSSIETGAYFLGALLLGENSTTRIHLYGGPLRDELVYDGLPKSYNNDKKLRRLNLTAYGMLRRPQEREEFNQPHYEILNEWKVGDRQKLNNTFFYFDSHGWYDYDASWAGAAEFRIDSIHGFSLTPSIANAMFRAGVDLVQWGWLPRYELQHDKGELTIGGEYRYHHGSHWGKLSTAEGLPPNFNPDYRTYQYDGIKHMASLYATETYRPTEELSLMGSMQLAYDQYQIQNEQFLHHSFSVPYWFVNPRIGANYNLTDAWNIYCSFAYTSREPRLRNLYSAEDAYWDPGATPQFTISGFQNGAPVYDYASPLVTPEELIDVELGAGYRTEEATVTVNVYWMEFTHELVKSGQVDIFGNPVYGNADRTRHIGCELDGSVQLPYSLSVSGNVSLSLNRIVKFAIVEQDSSVGGSVYSHAVKLDGNPIAGFPDVMGNFRFGYQGVGVSAYISAKYVGPFYTDNFKDGANQNDAFTVVNFESLYRLPRLWDCEITVRAEIRNVLNTLYMQTGEGSAFFPAAERNYLFGITAQL